jgi:hypothetical protein
MKKRLGVLLFLAAVIIVAACDRFAPTVDLLPNEQTVNIGDGAVAQFGFTADGGIVLEYGDGTEEAFTCDGSTVEVDHAYAVVGTYTARLWRNAQLLDRATVYVVAAAPVVRSPFWWQGYLVDKHEIIHFQVSESAHACDTATGAFDLYGVSAGDGVTEVRMFAWDSSGVPIGVFDFSRPAGDQAVWGEWLTMPDIKVEALTLSVFMNYYNLDAPKLPLAPRAAKGCDDDCDDWPEPPAPPEVGDEDYRYHAKFLVEARNQYTPDGQEPSYFWRVWYREESGCQ